MPKFLIDECLSPAGIRSPIQCELVQAALEELAGDDYLMNEVIEVDLAELEGEISVRRYPLPAEEQ